MRRFAVRNRILVPVLSIALLALTGGSVYRPDSALANHAGAGLQCQPDDAYQKLIGNVVRSSGFTNWVNSKLHQALPNRFHHDLQRAPIIKGVPFLGTYDLRLTGLEGFGDVTLEKPSVHVERVRHSGAGLTLSLSAAIKPLTLRATFEGLVFLLKTVQEVKDRHLHADATLPAHATVTVSSTASMTVIVNWPPHVTKLCGSVTASGISFSGVKLGHFTVGESGASQSVSGYVTQLVKDWEGPAINDALQHLLQDQLADTVSRLMETELNHVLQEKDIDPCSQ